MGRVRRLRRPRLLRRRRSLRKRRRRRKRRSKQILLEVKQLLSPKNIPDWFLFFLESQRFAVLKTKWLCIFYVKLYTIAMYIAIYYSYIGFLSLSCNKQNQHSWYGSKHSQWKILLHQKILVVEFV